MKNLTRSLCLLGIIGLLGSLSCESVKADWSELAETAMSQSVDVQKRYHQALLVNLRTGRGIPLSVLMTDNSISGEAAIAQAHSIAVYLVYVRGSRQTLFSSFQEARLTALSNRWTRVFNRRYGFRNLRHLQDSWLLWIREVEKTNHQRGVFQPGGS